MSYPEMQQLFTKVLEYYAQARILQQEKPEETFTVNDIISSIKEATGKERLDMIQALAVDLRKNYIVKFNDYTKDFKLYIVYDDGEEEQIDDSELDNVILEMAKEWVAVQPKNSSFGKRRKCCLFGKNKLSSRKNKIKVKCTMKLSKYGNRRRVVCFGKMSKMEAKKAIAKEVISFVRDVKKQVLTKVNIKSFFKILFKQKFVDLIKQHKFKELVKSRKEVFAGIKDAFKSKSGEQSEVGKFFSDKMAPILQVHFAKFAENMEALQTELCGLLSKVLSTAIMQFLMVVFAASGPFNSIVPLLRLKTIPDMVKKVCAKMTDKLLNKLKAAAEKGLHPAEIAAKVEEEGAKEAVKEEIKTEKEVAKDEIKAEKEVAKEEIKEKLAAFGKRRKTKGKRKVQIIFTRAAKKCKGTSNYHKCMGTTLRKMHRSSFGKKKYGPSQCKGLSTTICGENPNCHYTKRGCVSRKGTRKTGKSKVVYQGPIGPPAFGKKLKKYTLRGGRKSPGVSATLYRVGTRKRGLDHNMYTIKKSVNGVKRWVKVNKK